MIAGNLILDQQQLLEVLQTNERLDRTLQVFREEFPGDFRRLSNIAKRFFEKEVNGKMTPIEFSIVVSLLSLNVGNVALSTTPLIEIEKGRG